MAADNGKTLTSTRLGFYSLFVMGALAAIGAAIGAGIMSSGPDEGAGFAVADLGVASKIAQLAPEPPKPALVTPREAPAPARASPVPALSSPVTRYDNCPVGPLNAVDRDRGSSTVQGSICAAGTFIGAGIRKTIGAVMSTALGFCQAFFGHS